MRQRTGFRLGIAMVLVGAFLSTAMAQVALAQETTGATGSRGATTKRWSSRGPKHQSPTR